MTTKQMREVLGRVVYQDWHFNVGRTNFNQPYLQVLFLGADSVTHRPASQSGRKWLLSEHMTESELVQTALKAVLAAEEHEARERFTYKGAAIFGPHLDIEALVELADRKVVREPMPA